MFTKIIINNRFILVSLILEPFSNIHFWIKVCVSMILIGPLMLAPPLLHKLLGGDWLPFLCSQCSAGFGPAGLVGPPDSEWWHPLEAAGTAVSVQNWAVTSCGHALEQKLAVNIFRNQNLLWTLQQEPGVSSRIKGCHSSLTHLSRCSPQVNVGLSFRTPDV